MWDRPCKLLTITLLKFALSCYLALSSIFGGWQWVVLGWTLSDGVHTLHIICWEGEDESFTTMDCMEWSYLVVEFSIIFNVVIGVHLYNLEWPSRIPPAVGSELYVHVSYLQFFTPWGTSTPLFLYQAIVIWRTYFYHNLAQWVVFCPERVVYNFVEPVCLNTSDK